MNDDTKSTSLLDCVEDALDAAVGFQQILDSMLAGARFEPLGREGLQLLRSLHQYELEALNAAVNEAI